jgi:hypothetical protein
VAGIALRVGHCQGQVVNLLLRIQPGGQGMAGRAAGEAVVRCLGRF